MEMTRNAEKCRTMGENREEGRKIRRENMNSWRGEKKRRREEEKGSGKRRKRVDGMMKGWIIGFNHERMGVQLTSNGFGSRIRIFGLNRIIIQFV